ncbi:MAG: GNAT family N-acetyltransferase [Chloroflexota bacterium]
MRFFEDGESSTWIELQQASDPFFTATADILNKTMPGSTEYRAERIMFLVDPAGHDIGSIAAWQTTEITEEEIGQIHWVAILPEAQGRGLSVPMLGAACHRLQEMGHRQACLSTNMKRLPAVNLYLKFGFKPQLDSEEQKIGWEKIKPRLKY